MRAVVGLAGWLAGVKQPPTALVVLAYVSLVLTLTCVVLFATGRPVEVTVTFFIPVVALNLYMTWWRARIRESRRHQQERSVAAQD